MRNIHRLNSCTDSPSEISQLSAPKTGCSLKPVPVSSALHPCCSLCELRNLCFGCGCIFLLKLDCINQRIFLGDCLGLRGMISTQPLKGSMDRIETICVGICSCW